MNPRAPKEIDYRQVGRAIRTLRALENKSQEEFAESVGVSRSTLLHIENGRKIQLRMIERICESKGIAGLGGLLDFDRQKAAGQMAIHHAETAVWRANQDFRKVIPENNDELIQNSEERLRLLRVGLANAFFCVPQFKLPDGPASAIFELGTSLQGINAELYRDAILHCLAGRIRVTAEGQEFILGPGDFVGYKNDLDILISPVEPLSPHFEPPRLLWIGGNRVGQVRPRPLRKR